MSDPSLRSSFKGDFDPHSVPIKDAATILILDDRPDLQVLMMRRRARSEFVGGMMVFPGGGLDDADRDLSAFARLTGAVEPEHRPYVIAAARETFEECGVLLTATVPPEAALAEREAVQREELTFAELLERFDLTVDADHIYPIAQWITPIGPPRRYDTMFFLSAMPEGQEATGDDDEAEHLEWVRPADGMARWEAGEYVMLPPTTAMLKLLLRFERTAQVIESLRRSPTAMQGVAVVGHERGDYRVILPDEAGFPSGDQSGRRPESGWMRRLQRY